MVSLTFLSAVAAASLLSMASAQSSTVTVSQMESAPTEVPDLQESLSIGCFNSSTPLDDYGSSVGQSRGNCKFICAYVGKNVMAVSDGVNCWCGNLFPALDTQTNNGSCNTVCRGYGKEDCGGPAMYWVMTTGLTLNRIKNYEPPVSSSSTSQTPLAQSTQFISTVTERPTNTPSSAPSSGGTNKVGIAVGVVVGVLVLVAIIAGVFFFLRHKRRREVEEEYRRQANINSFTAGGKLHTSNSSMTDSRLDPEFMARRASNGSIADNEDYSRRILKVTNA
ncbi:hypothetical protein K505DRAFT_338053 [Melanomma pulvis-pyrius CBS 109.77]|uniref:WSC domain-containing protein n=1 Tax=Melanomma pulvis-pyrius CBS 109.77 TaxID=1314802 RepID=A0A6A6X9C0_9PLEO|nr:hypothetical protein K505DRAFT_338053 [Melanomma pulvis-pyrius CBS 109.77]